jgi:hypothetical protein
MAGAPRALAQREHRRREGWCLEVHDLATSKLVANRDRDRAFVRVLLQEHLVDPGVLDRRLRHLPLPAGRIEGLLASLRRLQNA